MEIITGRFAGPVLGFRNYGIINSTKEGYRGEECIVKKIIEPVDADGKKYSDLYMLERENLLTLPFNWIYVINEQWLRENKNHIFNHSYDNSLEFQEFVEDANFSDLEENTNYKKERNHLLTNLGIPFKSIDKVIIMRNYEGYSRAEQYIQKLFRNADKINHFKEHGSPEDRRLPKAIEFILK